jgi:hypothetical protein
MSTRLYRYRLDYHLRGTPEQGSLIASPRLGMEIRRPDETLHHPGLYRR